MKCVWPLSLGLPLSNANSLSRHSINYNRFGFRPLFSLQELMIKIQLLVFNVHHTGIKEGGSSSRTCRAPPQSSRLCAENSGLVEKVKRCWMRIFPVRLCQILPRSGFGGGFYGGVMVCWHLDYSSWWSRSNSEWSPATFQWWLWLEVGGLLSLVTFWAVHWSFFFRARQSFISLQSGAEPELASMAG